MTVSQELLHSAVQKPQHLYPQSKIIWSITMMYFGEEISFFMFHTVFAPDTGSIFYFLKRMNLP